jgi:hypothetical protein
MKFCKWFPIPWKELMIESRNCVFGITRIHWRSEVAGWKWVHVQHETLFSIKEN